MSRRRVGSPSASDDGTRSWQHVDGGSQHQDLLRNSCRDTVSLLREMTSGGPWTDSMLQTLGHSMLQLARRQRAQQRGAGSAAAMDMPDQWAQYAPQGAARLEQCQVPPAAAQYATLSAAPTHNAPRHCVKGYLNSWLVSARSSSFDAWGG